MDLFFLPSALHSIFYKTIYGSSFSDEYIYILQQLLINLKDSNLRKIFIEKIGVLAQLPNLMPNRKMGLESIKWVGKCSETPAAKANLLSLFNEDKTDGGMIGHILTTFDEFSLELLQSTVILEGNKEVLFADSLLEILRKRLEGMSQTENSLELILNLYAERIFKDKIDDTFNQSLEKLFTTFLQSWNLDIAQVLGKWIYLSTNRSVSADLKLKLIDIIFKKFDTAARTAVINRCIAYFESMGHKHFPPSPLIRIFEYYRDSGILTQNPPKVHLE